MRYFLAVFSIGLAIFGLELFQPYINTAIVAIVFLLLIVFIAIFIGRNPALLASFAAVAGFNFMFIPPVRTWTISEPQNWVAWAAFTVTAITVGELSAYAKRRAVEAETRKEEVKKLYDELQTAFEKASETEALRRSEKLKSALLDAVTHDLRTPLTSIKAAVTTLLESEGGHRTIELDAEDRLDFFKIINEETDRLNEFIEAMVELAKIESKQFELQTNLTGIIEIVENALNRAAKILKNHRVVIGIEENLPSVKADEESLSEVIYTLLDNAAKYSPENSKIEISANKTEDEHIEIAVADEGRGIPAEWRGKIFDKFFRIENKVNSLPKSKGTGLGLAIAKGIVEAHGGKIRVENGDKTGAKFIFTVPINK